MSCVCELGGYGSSGTTDFNNELTVHKYLGGGGEEIDIWILENEFLCFFKQSRVYWSAGLHMIQDMCGVT